MRSRASSVTVQPARLLNIMASWFRTQSMAQPALESHREMTQTRPARQARSTESERPRVMAVDDQQDILDAIELLLNAQGYDVETARSPQLMREALASGSYAALLIDLNSTRDTTSGQEGLALLS